MFCAFSRCNTSVPKTLTNQEWYVKEIHYAKKSQVSNISYYVVRFYPDETFALFGSTGFAFGQWRLAVDKKIIHIHPNFGDLRIQDSYWEIEGQKNNLMIIGMYQTANHSITQKDITLVCNGVTNTSDKDPFLLVENKWRKRPATLETDAQIKDRVMAYLHFLEAVYKHTFDNNFETLNYDWFAQPLRMQYSNAVRLAYSGNEMELWNKCFFDSAQAVHAYQLLGGAMYDCKLKATDNIADRNLDFVQQMIVHVK